MIDKYGEALLLDLRHYYGIDLVETIEGRGVAPSLVLSYVQGLPDTSVTTAFQQGGWEHHGWGQDRHMLASVYDAITFNTEATGHWDKTPSLGRWPRPTTKQDDDDATPADEQKPVSVKDLWLRLKK